MSSRTKVMHVLHAVGGVDVYLRLLSQAIDNESFELVVVHGVTDTEKPYKDKVQNPIKEYTIDIDRNIHLVKDFKSVIQLYQIIKKEKPDVIHAHSAKGGIIGRLAAFITSTKVYYTPHAFSYLSTQNAIKKKIFLGIEKCFRFRNVSVLATSESEAKRAVEDVGFKKDKVLIYENSVFPIDKSALTQALNFDLPSQYICSVGRPSYQKNIEAMVEVFKKLKTQQPDLYFVLMGVGYYAPHEEKIKNLLKAYQLEKKFIMLPWLSQKEIFQIIDKSKLYISTSRYEGLPYSVIESMALGKACVVSDCDGNRDLIIESENGFVIPQNQLIEKMPQKIMELLQDKDVRKQFEANALKRFDAHYNILNTIESLEFFYNFENK